jgi:peptidyl-prolyl cis-trans isomerase C
MKSCILLLGILSFAMFAGAQGTSTQTKPSPQAATPPAGTSQTPATPGQLKTRGAEAIAQQDPNKIVATINGHQITARQAMDLLKQVPDEQRRASQNGSQNNLAPLLQNLYMVDQFAGEAAKLKLDSQSPWKEQLDLNRRQILAQAYMNRVANNPGDTSAKQYYDSHVADFDQVKLSGILVAFNNPGTPASNASVTRTESEAKQKADDLEKKLKGGADFAGLARTDSDQQQSAGKGGDLGDYLLNDTTKLPPEVREVISKMKPGDISEPVRVPGGGYFIFKLVSRSILTFDKVRAGIIQKLEFDKYKIQIQDPDFFASSTPGANIPSLQRPTPPPAAPKPPSQ